MEILTAHTHAPTHAPQPGQAILITGCDSGFGYEAALRFAKAGWIVYAGCLSDAGMAALTAAAAAGPGKLVALRMDVTKSADVEAVVKRMVDDGVSLYALINNAVRVVGGSVVGTRSLDRTSPLTRPNARLTKHNTIRILPTPTTPYRESDGECPLIGPPTTGTTARSWR